MRGRHHLSRQANSITRNDEGESFAEIVQQYAEKLSSSVLRQAYLIV